MKIHNLRVFFLRQRNNIIFFIITILTIATFIILVIALSQIYEQSKQNQRLLKSLSCILLVLPEDRTPEKIENCVKINTGKDTANYEFIFETLEDSKVMRSDTDFIELLKDELRGEKGDTGATGLAGRNGVDGTDGQDGKSAVSTIIKEHIPIKGEQGDVGESGREVEFRHNNDRIEWRYVGEDFWSVLVNDCELLDNCP